MAAKAFVSIEPAIGKTKELATALQKLEEAPSVDPVTGPYDIITIVEGKSLTAIGDLVTDGIHPIPSISRTGTYLVIWRD